VDRERGSGPNLQDVLYHGGTEAKKGRGGSRRNGGVFMFQQNKKKKKEGGRKFCFYMQPPHSEKNRAIKGGGEGREGGQM